MRKVSVDEFLTELGATFEPQDHHFTGPPAFHQPECNGSVFHDEGKVLMNTAHFLGGPVLEIGTDQAISTRYIAEGLRDISYTSGITDANIIHTVDILQRWVDDPCWPEIVPFKISSEDFPLALTKYSWAFVDGDHSYGGVVKDIGLLSQLQWDTYPRALFHDCGEAVQGQEFDPGQFIDVRRAVLEHMKDWKLTEIDTKLGMIYAER